MNAFFIAASRSVFAYIVYIFLAPSSAFEAQLVGKSKQNAAKNNIPTSLSALFSRIFS